MTGEDPLARAYARRAVDPEVAARDSLLLPATARLLAERQMAMWRLLADLGWTVDTLTARRVLEVGCGDGGNLLDLLRGGCAPERLTGVERLPERAALARSRLPAACRVVCGDAQDLGPEAAGQDLVLLFTVMSSVLDPAERTRLADRVWQLLAPGGAVLLYDFTLDNPRNPAVRGVRPAEWRRWWPHAERRIERRLTLAPPIARRLGRATPWAYGLLSAVPGLCLHRLVAVTKARAG